MVLGLPLAHIPSYFADNRHHRHDIDGAAENGREAIEKAQLLRLNLIVTDLSMPVMNGLEATYSTPNPLTLPPDHSQTEL